jgi:hypothetical protein
MITTNEKDNMQKQKYIRVINNAIDEIELDEAQYNAFLATAKSEEDGSFNKIANEVGACIIDKNNLHVMLVPKRLIMLIDNMNDKMSLMNIIEDMIHDIG